MKQIPDTDQGFHVFNKKNLRNLITLYLRNLITLYIKEIPATARDFTDSVRQNSNFN